VLPIVPGKTLADHQNPVFARESQSRAFWRHSAKAAYDYAGGADASGEPILPTHPAETDTKYKARKSAAIVRPFVRSILGRFNDFVTRHDVTRPESTSAPYATLLKDATGQGVTLDRLLKRALRTAQVERCCYLLCDSSSPEQFQSAAAAMDAGKRGVIRRLSPDAVINWRDVDGEVVEALILLEDYAGPYLWAVDRESMTRVNLTIADINSPWGSWVVAGADAPIRHNYGACPLVRLCPDFEDESESQAAPISESQRRICNFESWHWEELRNITFTTTVLLGVDAKSVEKTEVGPGMALCLPQLPGGSLPGLGKISADTAQAASLREAIHTEVLEVYRAAGLAAGNPQEVGAPESGVAKAFRFDEVAAKLKALADACEQAENAVVMRLAKDNGWTYPGDSNWPDEFDTPDLAAELTDVIRLESSGAPAVLVEKAWRDYASLAFSLSPEETKRLDDELKAETQRKSETSANLFTSEVFTPPGR
jgi:hypothetical protein